MKHSKLLLAGALVAAAACSAAQAQTVIYGVEYYGTTSMGTTPSESNWSSYPSHPANIGYSISEYRDNYGVLRQRADPVVADRRGTIIYSYPESAVPVYPETTIFYSTPEVWVYPRQDPRY